MVLFVFVIMLLDLKKEQSARRPLGMVLSPIIAGVTLALIAIGTAPATTSGKMSGVRPAIGGEASASGGADLSVALFSRHVLAFEATSLLLLAAIVGVIVFAKKLAKRETLLETGGHQ